MARKRDPRFEKFAKKIFNRDQFTCQYCGFSANNYLDVVNIDGDYRNNHVSNLLTACPLCAQCFFLESVGNGSFGGGTLIYLPEISQNALNALCHVLFKAMTKKDVNTTTYENILRDFKFRSMTVDKVFGENMSEPNRLGTLILSSSLSKEQTEKLVKDIRLLPLRPRFERYINAWQKESEQQTHAATEQGSTS